MLSLIFAAAPSLNTPATAQADTPAYACSNAKAALKSVNNHFLKLPEAERKKGISAIAHAPPSGNLVADLWDKFLRKGYRDEPRVKMEPEKEAELVKRLKAFSKRRGSWWQVPKDLKHEESRD